MLIDARSRLAGGPTEAVIALAGQVILGKEHQIRLAMACILARGHLLIEDVPGVGKTTLSHALARLLGLDYQRIQFTSDLLPADVIGVSIFDRDSSTFRFHPGPIFAQIILADEINRASPKAQSALLEAMEEHQVTAEGETRLLPEPWLITPATVENIALRVQEAPDFAAKVKEAGIDPAELVAAVAALGFGEKVALLDQALQHQAPAAARALEEEP